MNDPKKEEQRNLSALPKIPDVLKEHPQVERRSGDERRNEPRRADDVNTRANLDSVPLADEATLMTQLRGLASTVRQCQRNGHPDLSAHLDALLKKLGA